MFLFSKYDTSLIQKIMSDFEENGFVQISDDLVLSMKNVITGK